MKASRDRGKKKAGKNVRPKTISDAELLQRVSEACLLIRQQNKELNALSQQRIASFRRPHSGLLQ
jgi:hypothetical protein